MNIGIVGVGSYLPRRVLTNAELEKMVDTSDEWIVSRTGIRERHIAGKGVAASNLGHLAAKNALKDAGLMPNQIELIVVATTTPDMQFPSTACLIQKRLNIKRTVCFDIGAACSGFVYAIAIAKSLIAIGQYKNALVIGAEVLSTVVDWKDRSSCVLFGDGAGACVLSGVKRGGILSTYMETDGHYSHLLELPGGGSKFPASHETVNKKMHYLKMHGSDVFKLAVRKMTYATTEVLKLCGLSSQDVDCLIPHQANVRIINVVAKKTGIPLNKVYTNLDRYGNMSSASTAVALCEAVKSSRVKRGDIVVLVAFGSGLAWGSCVIRW